jgi:outer membrane immunogenic protein
MGVALAAALAFSGPAAAGGSLKDAPVGEPAFSWSGFYIGAHAGGGWSKSDWSLIEYYGLLSDRVVPGDSTHQDLNGWLTGGQIGFLRQNGSFVYGLEASLSGSEINGSSRSTYDAEDDNFKTDIRLLATVTVRLGYARDRWLAYVKGGWAGADVETTLWDYTEPYVGTYKTSEWHNGFTVGGGLEYAIRDNIILGLEYAYIDLGSATHNRSGVSQDEAQFISDKVSIDGLHVVTGRIGYKF